MLFFISFELSNVEPLLNDFIRPRQHIRRNRHADLLRCLQIDHQLELRAYFARVESEGFPMVCQ